MMKTIARKTTRVKPPRTVKSAARPALRKQAAPAPAPAGEASAVAALRKEMTDLRATVEKSLSPVAAGSMDEVDALRRVLSYLFEAKVENVVRQIVAIRHATTSASPDTKAILKAMDALLSDLGAVRFEAERMEHVDPLIHTIAREVHDEQVDDGVVTEALRPGFRTARGEIIARALVAVNRRA